MHIDSIAQQLAAPRFARELALRESRPSLGFGQHHNGPAQRTARIAQAKARAERFEARFHRLFGLTITQAAFAKVAYRLLAAGIRIQHDDSRERESRFATLVDLKHTARKLDAIPAHAWTFETDRIAHTSELSPNHLAYLIGQGKAPGTCVTRAATSAKHVRFLDWVMAEARKRPHAWSWVETPNAEVYLVRKTYFPVPVRNETELDSDIVARDWERQLTHEHTTNLAQREALDRADHEREQQFVDGERPAAVEQPQYLVIVNPHTGWTYLKLNYKRAPVLKRKRFVGIEAQREHYSGLRASFAEKGITYRVWVVPTPAQAERQRTQRERASKFLSKIKTQEVAA